MQSNIHIAVIGAGIAGLSCATALKNAGFIVDVFEKSRGPSGRLSTRVTETWQCDHGAQYFTARDAVFKSEVRRWIDAGVAQLWQPRLQAFDGSAFTSKRTETEENHRYIGFPRNHSPSFWIAKELNLKTESTVKNLVFNNQQWKIESLEQGFLPKNYDATLLAIPAPQAAALLKDHHTEAFKVAKNVNMRPCFALMVTLVNATSVNFDGLFIENNILSWIAKDSAKPGRSNVANAKANQVFETWVIHASSAWSQAHVDEDKATISALMLQAFKDVMHQAAKAASQPNTPLLIQGQALHRWLYADCQTYLTSQFYYADDQHLGLCGDWLNGGKIQGAWLSGYQLARHLLKNLSIE